MAASEPRVTLEDVMVVSGKSTLMPQLSGGLYNIANLARCGLLPY